MNMGARQFLPFFLLAVFAAAPAFAQNSAAAPSSQQPVEAADSAPSGPVVTFRKIFKSSTPEFVEIKVYRDGRSTYDIRQLSDPPSPEPFPVSAALADKIFALAAHLHDFDGVHLNLRRRVANLGEKTFFYEKDGVTHQATFNYTDNGAANKLLAIFEGLSLEDQYADQLRRSMRYDPLGLNDVLIRLERDLGANLLAEPRALVPLLNRIATNSKFLDIARARARTIVASLGPAK